MIRKKGRHLVSPCYQVLSTAVLEEKLGFNVWKDKSRRQYMLSH
jgi:hypothetical protein